VVVVSFLWFVLQLARKWVLKQSSTLHTTVANDNFCCFGALLIVLLCHHNARVQHCCNRRPRWHCGEGTGKAGPQCQSQWHCSQLKRVPWSKAFRTFERAFFDRSITIPNTTCVSITKVVHLTLLAAQTIGSGWVQRGRRERSSVLPSV